MKIIECEQQSIGWMLLRLGKPTCSKYDSLLTPSKLKPATARELYGCELLNEWELGEPENFGSTDWMERGTDLEDDARRWYEFHTDREVQQVGFIARDDGKTGGSPDGLVGEDGGLEIKCLGAAKHRSHILKHPINTREEFVGQVQGYLYLTGREWWDILFYNPKLEKKIIRVYPNEKWVAAFVPVLTEFIAWLEEEKAGNEDRRNLHPLSPEIQAELKADAEGRKQGSGK